MKLRSLFVLAAGIGVGYALATRMRQDDPDVVHGPQRQQGSSGGPALRLVSGGAQRLADQAGVLSLDAIRRARGAIRSRLSEYDEGPRTTRPGTRELGPLAGGPAGSEGDLAGRDQRRDVAGGAVGRTRIRQDRVPDADRDPVPDEEALP